MKKLLSITLIILLALACVFVFAACGDKTDKPSDDSEQNDENGENSACTHVACEWIVDKEPTKTENGSRHQICEKCKETIKTEVLYALGLEELEFELNDDGQSYSVVGIGSCTDLDIVIPSLYSDLPVTSIGDYAFRYCSGLTSITIPDSVTSIGDSAFYGCQNLTSITIPDSVKSIGEVAFFRCTSLMNITIPDSVTSIDKLAFKKCDSLTSIVVEDGNPKYHSAGNCVIETATKTLVLGCKNSVIPTDGSVTSIGDVAFNDCRNLTSITIPDSVKSIGEGAFFLCESLTSITIPDSVNSIGDGAFYGCTGLTSIVVEDGNTKYHSAGNCLIETATKTLELGCKNSVIPTDGSVTSIGEIAFYGCYGLTSITIPDSVTFIGGSAFSGCTGLTSITIPDSVTSIGDSAFRHCSDLTSINFQGTKAEWEAIEKEEYWDDNTGNYTVYCTDGNIAK